MEKTETDRRFRNLAYGLMVLLLVSYGAFKYQMILLAFDHWEGQELTVEDGLAAK
jgi:hypothetical protein